jgi:hypothetical protein
MINNKDSRFSDPASSQLLILVALDWLGSKQFHPSVPSGVSPGNTRWIIYSKGSVSEKRLVIYYSSAIDYYSGRPWVPAIPQSSSTSSSASLQSHWDRQQTKCRLPLRIE